LDAGIAHFRRALEISPRDSTSRRNLGVALTRAGRLIDAARVYEEIIRTGEDAEAWNNYAFVLMSLAKWPDAEAGLRKAIALDANMAMAHDNLAYVLDRLGRAEEGLRESAAAARLEAWNADYRVHYAERLARVGDAATARSELEAALSAQPGHGRAHLVLAQILAAAGQRESALQHAQAAAKAGAPIPDSLYSALATGP